MGEKFKVYSILVDSYQDGRSMVTRVLFVSDFTVMGYDLDADERCTLTFLGPGNVFSGCQDSAGNYK